MPHWRAQVWIYRAMVREMRDRRNMRRMLARFSATGTIADFRAHPGDTAYWLLTSERQPFESIERDYRRGLLTDAEYTRYQLHFELATCARIALGG